MTIRPALPSDSVAVLAIRNDPDSVAFSPSQRPVSEEEHAAWFPRAIVGSPLFLVATDASGYVVGYVRIDALAFVSVALAPEARGQGVASELIRSAMAHIPGGLRAQVHADNAASRALFRRCGFKEVLRDGPWVLWVLFERETP